ncbi:GGDEF and EAL domain-containing protein [Halomonas lysinitropha]|uniref:Phytochrome-like protein cph2 n=1 Tax=Halomonas lysinitropha TaxID=2607506 RepID=A0A5K1I7D4_9GAMM|nr:GGDEF and EAL domain-containing protein [Halomonas lysinitropha]VVZ96381.1 Phytochrome-like protein cph2 [Halomonas lysinitropha]
MTLDTDQRLTLGAAQPPPPTLLRSAPVLIVDDTPSKRLAMKAALEPLGHRLVEADSGVAALRLIMQEDFAVILLDVTMPGMDGFETAKLIRERWQSEMTPIIFVTAFSSDEVGQVDHYAGGAVDFLFAPIPPAELRSKVSFFAHVFLNAENLAARSRVVQQTADQLRSLTDAAPIGIFQTDANNRYVYTNARWSEITGITADEALGCDWDSIIDAESRANDEDTLADSASLRYRFTIEGVEGGPRVVLVTTQAMHDVDGQRSGWVGTLSDITDLTLAQELLARTAAQQTAVAELGRYALAADDIASVARAAETTITGILGPDDWHARVTLRGEPDAPEVDEQTGGVIRVDVGDLATISVWNDSGSQLSFDGHQFVGDVANHLDSMLRRAGANVQFEHLATHDPLTELPNRTLFLDRLEQVQMGAKRTSHRHAVLFLDLDGFKFVNDGLGHDVGDQLLISVVDRLRSIMRPPDTLARFGGDEFAILCPNIGNERTALAIGARIQAALDTPFQLKSLELLATASIGIAIGDESTDGADLLRDADAAMYRAKGNGRNCVALFDIDIQRRAQEHLARATGLRGALANGEIEPHYQPIVNLGTGRVVGVEALARWRTSSGELISPDTFIALAEEIGLIEPLGQHILRTACRDALVWHQASPAPFMLSVNVSPRQFASGDFASMVLTALADTGFPATCLHLEITESALMNEPSVKTTMGELRKHGIKFAIDDFGTGYSSLSSLRRLPVDILKIDKSFVSGITTNAQDRALITAAIDLARSFGLTAIAEGVETQEQLRELTGLDCDLAQGYLWSRPVAAEKVADVMENVGKITHMKVSPMRITRMD